MDRIVFSVSCYNNEREIVDFSYQIKSLINSEKACLLVTCNKCKNIEALDHCIANSGIDYKIYRPDKNLGYLHGGLFGLSKYETDGNTYEWGIICNTDIEFKDKGFLNHIESHRNNSSLWGIAPNVKRKSNGEKQNPFMKCRITKNKVHLYKIIYDNKLTYRLFFLLVRIKRTIVKKEVPDIKSGYIYAMDGSIFVLRKPFIDILLNIQDDIFMYGEELYIAEMAYKNHRKIIYDNEMDVIHNENGTTSLVGIGKKQKWFRQSYDYLWNEIFSKEKQ